MCRSGFFETRSTLFYLFRLQTRPPTVLPGTPALHRRQPRSIPTTTRRSVDLTRRSVSPTRLPVSLAPRAPAAAAACWLFCCVSVFYFVCLLFFVLGYCLPVLCCIDLVVETFVLFYGLVPLSFSVLLRTLTVLFRFSLLPVVVAGS
jgi:hypothetical protein